MILEDWYSRTVHKASTWTARMTTSLNSESANNRVERVITAPAFSAVITLLIVLAGAAASLFTDAIREFNFPFGKLPGSKDSIGAFAFWMLVLLALVLLVINQVGVLRRTAREQDALNGALGRLDTAVRRLNTLPSEHFLPSFQDSFREALHVALLAIGDEDVRLEQVDASIRAVLAAVADTARDFDGAPSDAIYGANVMVFRDREQSSQIEDALQLVHVGSSHREYAGAIELLPQLSTCTEDPGAVDSRTRPISLPIPTERADYYDTGSRSTKSTVIPGAPTSYVKRTFDGFASIDAFLQRIHDHTSLDRQLVGKVQEYFTTGPGKDIKSFASLPIVAINKPSEALKQGAETSDSETPLGVLNIHSQRPGMLIDNGASLFAPLMGPSVSVLAILLVHRTELASVESSPPADRERDACVAEGRKQ